MGSPMFSPKTNFSLGHSFRVVSKELLQESDEPTCEADCQPCFFVSNATLDSFQPLRKQRNNSDLPDILFGSWFGIFGVDWAAVMCSPQVSKVSRPKPGRAKSSVAYAMHIDVGRELQPAAVFCSWIPHLVSAGPLLKVFRLPRLYPSENNRLPWVSLTALNGWYIGCKISGCELLFDWTF